MKSVSNIIYKVFLGLIIVIALLLLVSVFPIKGNIQVKIVESGSMEPAIHTGSLVVIKPESSYAIGDVITFGTDTKEKVPTSHRIVEMHAVSGEMFYVTKGDANNSRDPVEVPEGEVIGKVVLSIPLLGYILSAAKTPIGFAVVIVIPALVVVGDELRKIIRELRKMRGKKNTEIDRGTEPPGSKGGT